MGLTSDRNRTEDGFDVRSLAVSYRDGFTIGEHRHPWGQLVYGISGVMRVAAGDTVWFVPPTRAIWLPPGRPHRIVMQGAVQLRTLYLAPGRTMGLQDAAVALEVSPLLRELILHVLKIGMLDPHIAEHDKLAGVLADLIAQAPPGNLRLPMPSDPRASVAAEHFQTKPWERHDLDRVARQSGCSLRTLQRLFLRQTGFSMEAWRQKVRLINGVGYLSGGANVTEAALACGYDSTSAFIAVFKKQFGVTPGRYCRVLARGGAVSTEVRTAPVAR
ncbi:MAG: helix-turn-helix transcriptional regulator [Gammaproteobacteria bacterium]|nr:helix-turn-helix transcriptional regulator [Gammaproteobacteria bacterium]